MTTASLSSLPEPGLIEVPLERLHAHPANPNVMSAERAAKLVRHIAAEGRYPPLVARPHPEPDDHWQLLDGHQRLAALKTLGHETAAVFPWPRDDATALLLLGTLNALSGSDDPLKRAQLLEELAALRPIEELVLLLPEEERELEDALSLLALDVDACLAELEAAAAPGPQSPRAITVAVRREDEPDIELALERAMATVEGDHRRGQALAVICRAYLERTS